MAKGFIKLHRDLQDHWLWKEEPHSKAQAWIDLLMMANHAPVRFKHGSHFINVERGQIVTSLYKLADNWGWTVKKVRVFLQQLEADAMTRKETTKNYTILTVENYYKWQGEADTDKGTERAHGGAQRGHTQTVENTSAEETENAGRAQRGNEKGQQTRSKEIKNKELKDIKTKTVKAADPIPYEKVVDLFHSACPSLPGIIKLTDNRRKQIAARWHEYGQGIKPFYKLFHLAEASAFLKGQNNRQWTATLDWLLKADNMAKTLEGRYGNGTGGDGDARNGSGTGKSDQYSGISIDLDELEM